MWNPFGEKQAAPAIVASDKIVPVYYFDDDSTLRSIVIRALFRFDDVLDADLLKASLTRLLNREGWSKLGGRMRVNASGKFEYHVPAVYTEERPAFPYSHERYDVNIADHELASKLPKPTATPEVVGDLAPFVPLMTDASFPTELNHFLYRDVSLFAVRIVSFLDATLVTLSWQHSFADALGIGALLKAWSLVLQGRDDEVPPYQGAESDPLTTLGSKPTEPYKGGQPLSLLPILGFTVRLFADIFWNSAEETRMICMPATTLKKLHTEATRDLEALQSPDKPKFLSEGDILSAWITRYAISAMPHDSTRMISIMNLFGLRNILEKDLLPSPGASVCNMIFGLFNIFTANEIFTKPLSEIAIAIRRNISNHQSREQIEARAALQRECIDVRKTPVLYGGASMRLLSISNWSKARLYEIDFSAAIVTEKTAQESTSSPISTDPTRGKPTHIHPWTHIKLLSVRNSFGVMGKDALGNYWITGALRTKEWAAVERDIKMIE